MSPDRKYNEQEIAAIFKQAAADQEAAQGAIPSSEGLTLTEIEQIGKEAGITPEFIARAAAVVNQRTTTPPPQKTLGLPVSVARVVDLPTSFSDKDWDLLVADLHDTFHVPGEVRIDGSRRQWWNSQLHVLVEPSASGYRLRLRVLNEIQRLLLTGGLIFFLMGLFFMLMVAIKGDFGVKMAATLFVSMIAAVGLGGMGSAALMLPRWRKEKERQLEALTARILAREESQASADSMREASSPTIDLDETSSPIVAESSHLRSKTRA